MKYIANPIIADAWPIIELSLLNGGGAVLILEGHSSVQVTAAMLARFTEDGKELVPGDYFVKQADGYAYLNPKEVWERKYRPLSPDLTFGDAIEAIKAGFRVARRGWNGKDMWLCYGKGHPALPAANFWNPHTRAHADENGGTAPVLPYIIMKTAGGEVLMGWLASQSDMLAEDWVLITDE